jgi:hypothetical protein
VEIEFIQKVHIKRQIPSKLKVTHAYSVDHSASLHIHFTVTPSASELCRRCFGRKLLRSVPGVVPSVCSEQRYVVTFVRNAAFGRESGRLFRLQRTKDRGVAHRGVVAMGVFPLRRVSPFHLVSSLSYHALSSLLKLLFY